MIRAKWFALAAVILCCLGTCRLVHGYSSGADPLACSDMLPRHSASAQDGDSPFIVTQPFNTSSYDANRDYQVTLSLAPEQTTPFKGYVCQGRDASSPRNSGGNPIGTFVNAGAGGKMLECNGIADSSVTHTSSSNKQFITLTWRSPATTADDVEIRCTFVQTRPIFYQQVKPVVGPLPTQPTTQPVVTVPAQPLLNMSTAGCGTNKTCYYRPSSCAGASDCDFYFSQRLVQGAAAATVEVELAARLEDRTGWVAVGYSTDKKMGNDDVFGCQVSSTGRVFAKNLWNVGHGNEIDNPNDGAQYLTNIETAQNNGRVTCRFRRLLKTPNAERDLDLSQAYRLLFGSKLSAQAGGNEALGTRHDFNPLVSSGTVRVSDNVIVSAKVDERGLLKAHGAMMIDAWLCGTVVAIFLARFMRKAWDIPRWFWWHRFDMIIVWLMTMTSFILIFVDVDGFTHSYKTHAALGIIVVILTFIQPFIALFRCAPDDEKRYIFNWVHRSVGYGAQILAIINVYLGIDAYEDLGFDIDSSVKALFIVWLVITVVTYFGFLAYDVFVAGKDEANKDVPMQDVGGKDKGQSAPDVGGKDKGQSAPDPAQEKSAPDKNVVAKDACLRMIVYYSIFFFTLIMVLAIFGIMSDADRKVQ